MDLNDEQKKDAVSDGVPAEPVSPQTAQAGQSPAPGEAAEVKQKKENMPKSTTPAKPTECAACGKHLKKKLWHYRNGAYFCNSRCFHRKVEEDKKKAEAASKS
ncbi:MAG: hypothetical protein PHT95_01955 [Candidatus Omnitrophica bacterium]|jgi:hypothetical protein|nr:hypothetical protein [Candidatus Omnitrophota bacterium]MDD4012719.1 hypothetical protein [Candidatus Omnitrophota bacterium]